MNSKTINQSQTVMNILRKRAKSKMTTQKITELVNAGLKPKQRLNPVQISKCLNKLAFRGLVSSERTGTLPTGGSCNRWSLNSK